MIKRLSYLEIEIANLMINKMKENKDTKESIYIKYNKQYTNLQPNIISIMLSGKINYSKIMFSIASDYLNIPYEQLVSISEDNSLSSCGEFDKDYNDFLNLVDNLFEEMIFQDRLLINQ